MRYQRLEAKDAARERMRGIFTAFCLPESREGVLDEAGLRADIAHCIEILGCGGLYVHGFYANFWLIGSVERRRILEIVLDEARGRVPVICRCAHDSLDETVALIAHAEAVGADFISLLGPSYAGDTEEMVVDYFEAVAATTNLGISVFNTVQRGYVMSPELLARLAKIPNVCAIKNHVPLEHTQRVRELVGDSILVVDPEEERLLDNMLEFGQQVVFTGCNMMFDSAAARPMHDYVEAALAGLDREAAEGWHSMDVARDIHHRWVIEPWVRTGRCPIATVKVWAGEMGMHGGTVRVPLPVLGPGESAALLGEVRGAGLRH